MPKEVSNILVVVVEQNFTPEAVTDEGVYGLLCAIVKSSNGTVVNE